MVSRTTRWACRGLCAFGLLAVGMAAGPVPQDTQEGDNAVAFINDYLRRSWQSNHLTPAPQADDAEFLRRATLDIAGTIPSSEEARHFLADRSASKRADLIDRLLASDEYADRWTDVWGHVLHNDEPGNAATNVLYLQLAPWLRDQFRRNRPWNELARDLVLAEGDGEQHPEIGYLGHMLAQKEGGELDAAQAISNHFLGIAIACARCHDHPFAHWTQHDYYDWAAYLQGLGARARQLNQGQQGPPQFDFALGDGVGRGRASRIVYPDTNEPARPKFIGETTYDASVRRRESLADKLTDPGNLQFARAVVNRYWGLLFGRGLVHPADGFADNNPPAHPELLDGLAQRFIQHGYDLRWLLRTICSTDAYQHSCRLPRGQELPDDVNYTHARMRPLMAGQMLSVLLQALGGQDLLNRQGGGGRRQRPGQQGQGQPQGQNGTMEGQDGMADPATMARVRMQRGMEQLFDVDPDDLVSYKVSLQQVLSLMHQENLQRFLERRVAQIAMEQRRPEAILEELFITFLSRPPTAEEASAFLRYAGDVPQDGGGNGNGNGGRPPQGGRPQGRMNEALAPWTDIAWSLMNSSEFTLNH